MTEQVVIIGGYHDGIAGEVHPAVIKAGFLVQLEPGPSGGYAYGYRATGEVDAQGRHIFRPAGGDAA